MVQYETWGIEIARSCCGEGKRWRVCGGCFGAHLRNGIVSLHVTWVNEMEGLVRPLFL